jgi:hypothetical protein
MAILIGHKSCLGESMKNITSNMRRLVLWQQARGLPCQGPIVVINEYDCTHSIHKRLSSERVVRRMQESELCPSRLNPTSKTVA